MVKPACKQPNQKKRKNRAGKKTHANRVTSHSRWLKRQALKTLSRVEPTENISSITTSESEIPICSIQKISNSETEIINSPKVKSLISDDVNDLKPYSPELTAFEELYQNINYQRETLNQIIPLREDLISQLISQVSDEEHLRINEYAQYLDS